MSAAGLFDFQVNGFGGVDFQRDNLTSTEFAHAVAALRQHGTSGIFATLITDEIDALCRRFAALEKFCATVPSAGAAILGYHLEGPWLSPTPGYRGAHPAGPMRAPTLADYERLQAAAHGRLRLITLAPEWPGSAEFIAAVTQQGVHVSLGHTNASEAEIDAAIRAGARFARTSATAVRSNCRVMTTSSNASSPATSSPPVSFPTEFICPKECSRILSAPNPPVASSSRLTPWRAQAPHPVATPSDRTSLPLARMAWRDSPARKILRAPRSPPMSACATSLIGST